MDQWPPKFSESFGLDRYWSIECSFLKNDSAIHVEHAELVKVARLQSEFCTNEFFRATNSLTKNAPKFSPMFLSLYFVGQKSSKIPTKFPTEFPSPKAKKITDELLQECGEKSLAMQAELGHDG